MSNVAVSVESVSKKFCRNLRQGMCYAAADIAREALGLRKPDDRLRPGEFWALRDLSFELRRGECLGVVGTNGAGKSTLLKLLSGIIRPSRGRIRMRGRVGGLIEVGAGFHPLLSGRENVYVNGAILGMSAREIRRKFESIVEFAGLPDEVLDAPVKTYSTGMYVRLGFAVAAHCEPDVLLVDEVLSVGDLAFSGRCREYIAELVRQGTAILLVSHQLQEIERICQQVLFLRGGQAVDLGPAGRVLAAYRSCDEARCDRVPDVGGHEVAGPRLGRVCLTDAQGAPVQVVRIGDVCTLSVELAGAVSDWAGELVIWIHREEGQAIPAIAAVPWSSVAERSEGTAFTCRFPVHVIPGQYRIGVRIDGSRPYEYLDKAQSQPFAVVQGERALVPSTAHGYALLDLRLDEADPNRCGSLPRL